MLPHYRQVTVLSREGDVVEAQMRAIRRFGPIPVPVGWRSKAWPDSSIEPDLQLRFVHTGGPTRGMNVTWHITAAERGSNVAIVHEFSRPLPLVGSELFPAVVDRLFVRPIAGQTLATFKRLAEAQAKT